MISKDKSVALAESVDGVICFYEDSEHVKFMESLLKDFLPNVPFYSSTRGIDALNKYKSEVEKGNRVLIFTDLNKGMYFSGEVLTERIRMHESYRGGGSSVIIAISPKDDSYLRKAKQYEFDKILGFNEILNEKKFNNMLNEATVKFRN